MPKGIFDKRKSKTSDPKRKFAAKEYFLEIRGSTHQVILPVLEKIEEEIPNCISKQQFLINLFREDVYLMKFEKIPIIKAEIEV
ncbi:MAG: hypothetical protein ACC656_05605 [Candidatus Heimdallarchaeota archaeon]